jgi:hypothetical protein
MEVRMKLAILVLCLTAISALVYAVDLQTAAKREKERRQALAEGMRVRARSFGMEDLERYAAGRATGEPSRSRVSAPVPPERDYKAERSFWHRERERYERELARVDAGIRRLEWRLRDKRAKKRPGERLSPDPSVDLLEESLESLRDERRRLEERFRERARKAGALPGWLREP